VGWDELGEEEVVRRAIIFAIFGHILSQKA
jgi:hypothetical protein